MLKTLVCTIALTLPVCSITTQEVPAVDTARVSFLLKEYNCMKEALWYEIRGGSTKGIEAVANVILNRRDSSKFKEQTVCQVITKPKQFSYRNHLTSKQKMLIVPSNKIEQQKLKVIEKIAYKFAIKGKSLELPRDVLWYSTTETKRVWMRKLQTHLVLDGHKFMKEN